MNIRLKQQQGAHAGFNQSFSEALNAYDKKEYPKALQIIQKTALLEKHTPSRLLRIELLCKMNKVNEALNLLTQWLMNDETNETWYRALQLLHNAGVPTATILSIFSKVEAKNSKNILVLLYKADIYANTHLHSKH